MSDYVVKRLREIDANYVPKAKRARRHLPALKSIAPLKMVGPKRIVMHEAEAVSNANLYVKAVRRNPTTPDEANWFEVRDAYIAGFEAALRKYAK